MFENSPKQLSIKTVDGYDLWSTFYDSKQSHTVQAARASLQLLKPPLSNRRVLEIGCGTADNFYLLETDNPTEIVGIDFSQGMLERARSKTFSTATRFIHHDVDKGLPVPDQTVDVVIVSLVLEHLIDVGSLFREIARVLSPGGRSLIIELHPYQSLKAAFARFNDQNSDVEYHMNSKAVTFSDLFNAHREQGLFPDRVVETSSETEALPSVIAILSTHEVL